MKPCELRTRIQFGSKMKVIDHASFYAGVVGFVLEQHSRIEGNTFVLRLPVPEGLGYQDKEFYEESLQLISY